MTKQEVLETIKRARLVPVIRTPAAEEARRILEICSGSGLSVFELTMTTPDAVELIREYAFPDSKMLVGAGTVLTVEQAQLCVAAGAKFIVSPVFDRKVVEFCRSEHIAVMPAGLTPTEVYTAWHAGADVVKVFPCGAVGGASYIKALKSVFPEISLMPTGGVTLETVKSFIDAGAFAVGAGTDLVDLDLLRNGEVDRIKQRIERYLQEVG
jgi:2-dehydro-3-deoxyphosphogluconate aldolase / (4S)-4-hydroxy-2-oxoglutarate aldolase